MRAHVSQAVSNLSRSTNVSPEELVKLKAQGANLLNCLEKALVKRRIALLLEDLEGRRPVLRDFSQKYEALVGLRVTSPLSAGVAPGARDPQGVTAIPAANVSTEDFAAELRKVREQIFRALGELSESGEGK